MTPDDRQGVHEDQLRVSDAERDLVVAELGERFAEGRLSQDTFARRIDAALHASARGELGKLLADLPRDRKFGEATWRALSSSWRRAVRAVDRWTRKAPLPLVLPSGSQLRFTIGREPACDMTLADKTVSRWHASLNRRGDDWLLTDLGSTNGTRVNGWRLREPMAVLPGDVISFGAATYVVLLRPGHVGVAATS